MVAFDLSRDWDVKISRVAQLYSLFVLPRRTEKQGPLCGSWVILPGVWVVFFLTHCLSVYLIYSSNSLYISQPSSANSHSLMINRAAALALPLTATCKLVTLNDSPMHGFTHTRGRRARRAWWSRVLCENRGRGKRQKTRYCNTRLSSCKDSAQRKAHKSELIMLTLHLSLFFFFAEGTCQCVE